MAQRLARAVGTDDGRHDFDFWFGTWRQVNRKRVKPLVAGDPEWVEFESVSDARPIVAGLGNVDTFKAPAFPGRPGFEGFSLRLFDPDTGLWRIWWASTVGAGHLDAPVVGRFQDGIGRFECDDVVEGVPVKVRYTWKGITESSATWEQAFSVDGGETWDTNWIMAATRTDLRGAA